MNELELSADRLRDHVAERVVAGAQVLTFVGTDDRPQGGGFGLHLVLLANGETAAIKAALPADDPRYPSIAAKVPLLHWDERELRDLLGVEPVGHPDARRLVLRADWPDNLHPLRKEFEARHSPPPPDRDSFSARTVDGAEVIEVPVGPIHAGIIEPGHFRFSTVGETMLHLDAQLFYTHRGLEKLAEGCPPARALLIAERVCGACALSHAVAFSLAVESITDHQPPRRATWARTLLLEVERLYNHLGDAGNMCAGGALAVGTMIGASLKDQVQRELERLVGHRFGRGAIAIGGLRRDLPADALDGLAAALPKWRRETERFQELALGSEGFVNRMRTTGIIEPQVVRELGGVGVLARAAGVSVDLRRDRPYLLHPLPHAVVRTQTAGDAEARFRQRLDEAFDAFDALVYLLSDRPVGPIVAPLPPLATPAAAIGAVESPRGANVHWLRIDSRGLVDRLRVRSASFPNWAIVPLAVPGNLVPDFPMINKSFELCYSCLDR